MSLSTVVVIMSVVIGREDFQYCVRVWGCDDSRLCIFTRSVFASCHPVLLEDVAS